MDRDKARCTLHVSSSPPLRTGRAAFTAPGSTPLLGLHGVTMERRCPLLQFHGCPPVDRWRVHWGPVFPSAQRRGACAVRPHTRVRGLPTRRLLCPIRLASVASSCRAAFPPHDFPTALRLPRGISRVPPGRRTQHAGGGGLLSWPLPLLAAPQAVDRGDNRLTAVPCAPVAGVHWSLRAPLVYAVRLAWLLEPTRALRGSLSRRAFPRFR